MSIPRLSRSTAVAVLTAASLSLLAAPAHADTVRTRDARLDVVTGDADSPTPTGLATGRREGDVTAFTVTHAPHRVRMQLQLDQLTRPTDDLVVHSFRVVTDEHVRVDIDVLATAPKPAGEVIWTRHGRRGPEECPGVKASIDYAARTVGVSVPRGCLSLPRWVRAGGGSGSMQGHTLYADDAQLDAGVGDDLVLGRRVRR